MPSHLRCQLQHQLFQQTFLAALEDGNFGERWKVNTEGDLCPEVDGQLLQDFILSHDLLVDVKMLVPVVNTLSQLFANVMATQVSLHLSEGERKKLRK